MHDGWRDMSGNRIKQTNCKPVRTGFAVGTEPSAYYEGYFNPSWLIIYPRHVFSSKQLAHVYSRLMGWYK